MQNARPLAIHRSPVEFAPPINGAKPIEVGSNLGPGCSRVADDPGKGAVYVCVRNGVYRITFPMDGLSSTQAFKSSSSASREDYADIPSSVTPHPLPATKARCLLHHNHKTPVQSVATWVMKSGACFLSSVDARGTLVTTRLNSTSTSGDNATSLQQKGETPKVLGKHTTMRSNRRVESGWSGIAVSPHHGRVAIAQHFDRTISCVDLNHPLRADSHSDSSSDSFYFATRSTGGTPTDLAFLGSSGNCLAVTEGNCIALWDLRCERQASSSTTNSNPRSTMRHCPSTTQLLALCAPPTGTKWPGGELLVAGEDRFVYTIDPRKWRVRSRWRTPLKYEPAAMVRSPSKPSLCYVAGMDNDIMCGEANPGITEPTNGKRKRGEIKNKDMTGGRDYSLTKLTMMHQTGFRGDAPWCGMVVKPYEDHGVQTDLLVAVSQSAALYAVKNASKLSVVRD